MGNIAKYSPFLLSASQPIDGLKRYYIRGEISSTHNQEITMKAIATLIATLFAVTAFAAEPAKKEEKKVEAKPAATAPAKDAAKQPVKSEDKKAETTKK